MKNKFKFSSAASLVLAVCLLASCSRIPDHAKYIPKDAVVVAGVDLKALTKKVAWNAITGSKLFDNMQKKVQGGQKVEDAGVDMLNTMYIFIKRDDHYTNEERMTGLIPLSDAAKWEKFLSGVLPGVPVSQNGGIHTIKLDKKWVAGWTNKVLMITNVVTSRKTNEFVGADGTDSTVVDIDDQTDEEVIQELQKAFAITAENQLIHNKRYAALEREGHDILFWMNYEQMMNQYNGRGGMEWMSSLSGLATFWKDAAMTAGIDFDKGCINADMHYYIADNMHELGKELGGTKADDEIISKLPSANLDLASSYHLSTKGMHDLLDKLNVLGLANLALSAQNMDVDYILNAFTGDMAFSINDFKIKQTQPDSIGGMSEYEPFAASANYTFLLKLNKKENFEKLLGTVGNVIHPQGNNTYSFAYGFDSVYMVYNNQYAVISNSVANATAALQSKAEKKQGNASLLYGHPFGAFIDFQQIASSLDPRAKHGADSVVLVEGKKMFKDLVLTGADFKNNNFSYSMQLNLMNKDENSLLQIMDLAVRMSELNKDEEF